MRSKRRWGDINHYFGPFTYSPSVYSNWAAIISSGDNDEDPGCHVRLSLGKHVFFIELPAIIKPYKKWIDLSHETWSKSGGYWDIHSKDYGFNYSDGFLQVYHGPQTGDSLTDKTWCYFIPWMQWSFVRETIYGLDGEYHRTFLEKDRVKDSFEHFRFIHTAKDEGPARVFLFIDYDKERILARTQIQEMEWDRGSGWFKWLRYLFKPKTHRSLDIQFSAEVGPNKGSWKGGTLGHSIEMLDAKELHYEAFKRYCEQNNMTFICETSQYEWKILTGPKADYSRKEAQCTQSGTETAENLASSCF